MSEDIQKLEMEIFELTKKLKQLRGESTPQEVSNYSFDTLTGTATLRDLFGDKSRLLAIHNMGQGCRYCTLWGDGINGFVPHLESTVAVVLLSKDSPAVQQRFANSRQWRMRMASHGGGVYMQEQIAQEGMDNMPGIASYELRDNKIYRTGGAMFGPGDLYCSIWNFLALAGYDESSWTPQFNYWVRPDTLDDGGNNVLG